MSEETRMAQAENQSSYGHNLLVYTTTARVFREKFATKQVNELSNPLTPKVSIPIRALLPLEASTENKLELSINFKEFYRAQLSEIQYEIKV